MKKPNPMIIMMKLFIKSLIRYGNTLGKQTKWLHTYVTKTHHTLNQDPMFNTNLKLWLSEAEDTFNKRICPCFCPTGDLELDKKLLCPCKFMEDDIRLNGTCHCTLFAGPEATKETYQKAQQRLMKEYQTPMLRNEAGEIDITRYPIEERRGLRVPDAYHLIKRAAIMDKKNPIRMFLEHPYEIDALRKWGEKNGYAIQTTGKDGDYHVIVTKSR